VSALTRFLGDSPLRVIVKLTVISLIVGFLMNVFHWTPWDIYDALRDTMARIWNMGWEAIGDFLRYIIFGAMVVVPVFLIIRILNIRR
jgi:hypothetical protein